MLSVLSDYGVTDGHWKQAGSGNLRLSWTHQGKPGVYFFPSTPGDIRAQLNAVAGLKRLLGEPTVLPPRQHTTLDQMWSETERKAVMLQPVPTPEPPQHGTIALYISPSRGNHRSLCMCFPTPLYEEIGRPVRLLTERVSSHTWRLAGDVLGTKVRRSGRFTLVETTQKGMADGIKPFGATPSECVVVDGAILVSVDPHTLKPSSHRASEGIKLTPRPEPAPPVIQMLGDLTTRTNIKLALAVIQRVEAEMPLRLIRDKDGHLSFKLDLGC
jgi:hypothetical protein